MQSAKGQGRNATQIGRDISYLHTQLAGQVQKDQHKGSKVGPLLP